MSLKRRAIAVVSMGASLDVNSSVRESNAVVWSMGANLDVDALARESNAAVGLSLKWFIRPILIHIGEKLCVLYKKQPTESVDSVMEYKE